MNGTLKVSTAKLTSTASQFQSYGNQVKNITNQMTSTVNALSGTVWTGDAANAYKKKFTSLQDDINRMCKMINEHVTDLQTMAKQYETVEQANMNLGNSLSGDVIV